LAIPIPANVPKTEKRRDRENFLVSGVPEKRRERERERADGEIFFLKKY
jgi:hypothetical protein